MSTAPLQENAAIGATLEITTTTGKAAYTVANFQRTTPADLYIPVKGTLYAVDVTIQVETGTVNVNPFWFNARTDDGTNLKAALAAVDNPLTYGDIPQGRKLAGPLAFDVPSGKSIVQIVLNDPLGRQLGLWSVA